MTTPKRTEAGSGPMLTQQNPAEPVSEPLIPAPKRAAVLAAVVEGLSDRRTAKRVGVDPETVSSLRRAPSFAAEVEREVAALHRRSLDAIASARLVGLRRLIKDARTNRGSDGTRAAIELAKLGLPQRVENSGPDGGAQRHEVSVTITRDEAIEIARRKER
jgi:hypothetical protein